MLVISGFDNGQNRSGFGEELLPVRQLDALDVPAELDRRLEGEPPVVLSKLEFNKLDKS